MPHTKQSSYSVMTLSQWLVHFDNDLVDVVRALCEIFGLPDGNAAYAFIAKEVELQGHLLLFGEPVTSDEQPKIVAVAGWRWTKCDDYIAAFLGARADNSDEFLRHELIGLVIARLDQERQASKHFGVKNLILQYSPIDRQMSQACLDFGSRRYDLRNTFFRDRLGARWSLRSMILPFSK